MNRMAVGLFITALGLAACSSCSSSNSGDGGTSGGSCANVAVCTVIPLAQVNTATNKMLTSSSPTTSSDPVNDQCSYTGTGATGGAVNLTRACFNPGNLAGSQFDADKGDSLAAMGTRTDVAGLGDKAFYQSEPTGAGFTTTKVKLEANKGALLVILTATNVAPADDPTVKQGLIGFANTLLK